jgi:hypothetical protein
MDDQGKSIYGLEIKKEDHLSNGEPPFAILDGLLHLRQVTPYVASVFITGTK